MSEQRRIQTDEEVIASLGFGRFIGRTRRRARVRAAHRTAAAAAVERVGYGLWNNRDNLEGREAMVEGGPANGLRIVVREHEGRYRYPDVIDLTGYTFDVETWTWRWR